MVSSSFWLPENMAIFWWPTWLLLELTKTQAAGHTWEGFFVD